MQIRVAEERDAAALAEIYSYYVEKTAITFEYETPSTEESWDMPMAPLFIRELLMAGAPRCPSM